MAEVRPKVQLSPGADIMGLVKVVVVLALDFVLLTAEYPYLL